MDEYDDYGGDYGGAAPYQDYTGPTGNGQGGYNIGGQWYPIEAPGQQQYGPGMSAGEYDASRGAPPNPRTSGYGTPGGSYYDSSGSVFSPPAYSPPPSPRSQGASQGARSVAQQQPNLISMGTPERTLYDRYKSMLMQPDQLQQDPAYQFMYNQGLQALNRNLAAKRMTMSGKGMNDTMAYGSGMAAQGMKQIMPLYQAGAGEELNRFMGPAGLLPRYASSNNAAISGSNQMVNNADDRAMYANMLQQPGGGGGGGSMDWGSGIGYGGASSRYTPSPSYPQRSLAMAGGGGGNQEDYGLDLLDEDYYNG